MQYPTIEQFANNVVATALGSLGAHCDTGYIADMSLEKCDTKDGQLQWFGNVLTIDLYSVHGAVEGDIINGHVDYRPFHDRVDALVESMQPLVRGYDSECLDSDGGTFSDEDELRSVVRERVRDIEQIVAGQLILLAALKVHHLR